MSYIVPQYTTLLQKTYSPSFLCLFWGPRTQNVWGNTDLSLSVIGETKDVGEEDPVLRWTTQINPKKRVINFRLEISFNVNSSIPDPPKKSFS